MLTDSHYPVGESVDNSFGWGLWLNWGGGNGCVLQGNVKSSSICPSPVSPVLHNGQTTIVVKKKNLHLQFVVAVPTSYWSAHCTMLQNQQSRQGAILYLMCYDAMAFKMSH